MKPLSAKLIRDEDNIVILEATWEESNFMYGVEHIIKKREEIPINIVPAHDWVEIKGIRFDVLTHEEFWGPGGKVAFLERIKK